MSHYLIEKITLLDGRVLEVKRDLDLQKQVPIFCCGNDGGNFTWCCVKKPTQCKEQPYLNCEFCTCPNKETANDPD